MPRPRGGDWLEDEIDSLRRSGVDVVVSLLEDAETRELELGEEGAFCEAKEMRFVNFPIKDRSVPSSRRDFINLATQFAAALAHGQSIVIHCRQGIGRSSLLAACVLVVLGLSPEQAFERIEEARGCSVPDTKEQREWLGVNWVVP